MFSRLLLGWLAATALIAPAWAADRSTLQIIVSKNKQTLAVYDGTEVVATSRVSTGKPGHDTPTGIFSVLEKKVYHESNLYSAAPMPFMQRLTWSGIALHESNSVPRYPASHGCVRLPAVFAKQLYRMTQLSVPVIISDGELEPAPVGPITLFRDDPPPAPLFSDLTLRPGVGDSAGHPVEVAMNGVRPLPPMPLVAETADEGDRSPIRILITRRAQREDVIDTQRLLGRLGFTVGEADGLVGRSTIDAINAFKKLRPEIFRGDKTLMSERLLQALYEAAGQGSPPNGVILVRQDFKPIIEAPVTIADDQHLLGTHFLVLHSAGQPNEDERWLGVSLKNRLSPQTMKRLGIDPPGSIETDSATLDRALARITVPLETRKKISAVLGRGATLTISDTGNGPETGKGTDFITLTRG